MVICWCKRLFLHVHLERQKQELLIFASSLPLCLWPHQDVVGYLLIFSWTKGYEAALQLCETDMNLGWLSCCSVLILSVSGYMPEVVSMQITDCSICWAGSVQITASHHSCWQQCQVCPFFTALKWRNTLEITAAQCLFELQFIVLCRKCCREDSARPWQLVWQGALSKKQHRLTKRLVCTA